MVKARQVGASQANAAGSRVDEGNTPSYSDQLAALLNDLLANSLQQTIKLVWNTFETTLWRPIAVGSDHPRRSWWNDVAPVPSATTQTPFAVSTFGANVVEFAHLAFFIDPDLIITAHGQTLIEAAALVDLSKARIEAATAGLPR